MAFGLRSVAFVSELIHQPARHDPRALQKLHGDLFGDAHCSYRDFRLVAGGAMLSNTTNMVPGQPISCATLLADRIQIREEQTGTTKEDMAARTRAFAEAALSNVPGEAFLAQQFTVRSVLALRSTNDARSFVLRQLLGLDDESLSVFPSEPNLGGLRLAFPPHPGSGAIYAARVESYAQDERSVFVEVVGTFPSALSGGELDELGERFDLTYLFIQDHLAAFVGGFDNEGAP